MFIKRVTELNLLNKQYENPGTSLVILYGRKGIGKTTLLREFMTDKPAYYYSCVDCAERMQLNRMNSQWQAAGMPSGTYIDYADHFSALVEHDHKTVIILDEFHLLLKEGSGLLEALGKLNELPGPVMLILCSSSIRFVENDMVGWMGAEATRISAFLKLKEFTFVDFVNRFPKSTVETCIHINGILGGIPDYLEEWRENRTLKENMIAAVLDKNSRLYEAPLQYLKLELREPAVYSTLLAALAEGNRKLNDLHISTGYSRAKILVYLKLLAGMDIVEKLVPLEEEGRENAMKGLYRIRDHYLHFWYRFVFPHLSELELGLKEQVYDNYISTGLDEYMEEYFSDVCMEYLKLMNQHDRLKVKYQWWDRWYGKNGTIDVIAKGGKESTLAGKCIWKDRSAGIEDYEVLRTLAKEAGLKPEQCYLFSRNGFTGELAELARGREDLILVGLEDL